LQPPNKLIRLPTDGVVAVIRDPEGIPSELTNPAKSR